MNDFFNAYIFIKVIVHIQEFLIVNLYVIERLIEISSQ